MLRLKEWRTARQYTQLELATLLGIKRNMISEYESGKHEPNLKLIIQVCEILNISPNDLIEIHTRK